jgi:hypothetical protein
MDYVHGFPVLFAVKRGFLPVLFREATTLNGVLAATICCATLGRESQGQIARMS